MQTEIEILQKRIDNTDRALLALVSLLTDTMPPSYADDVNNMMRQFFDSGKNLGSTVGFMNEFHHE